MQTKNIFLASHSCISRRTATITYYSYSLQEYYYVLHITQLTSCNLLSNCQLSKQSNSTYHRTWSRLTSKTSTNNVTLLNFNQLLMCNLNMCIPVLLRSTWSNYFWPMGHFPKTWQLMGQFK